MEPRRAHGPLRKTCDNDPVWRETAGSQTGGAMGNFFKAVRSGLQAMSEGPEGERFVVVGKPVACAHCAHDRFVEGHAQLNTAGLSFLNLDWANRTAATLMCTRCGHIAWFLEAPETTN